jgi:excisionase family DNA binding protein
MNNQALPFPNPGDWVSIAGAAEMLGVSGRTVARMVDDGRLRSFLPEGAFDRPANRILWRADVDDLKCALLVVSGARQTRR